MPDLTALLQLRMSVQAAKVLQVDTHCGEVAHGLRPGVEVLMLRSEWDLQGGVLFPVIAHAIDDAEARALDDVDGFLAMFVPAGVAAWRDLRDQALCAPGAEAKLRGDQQPYAIVLDGLNPLDILLMGDLASAFLLVGCLVPHAEPFVVERHPVLPLWTPSQDPMALLRCRRRPFKRPTQRSAMLSASLPNAIEPSSSASARCLPTLGPQFASTASRARRSRRIRTTR